MFLNIADDSLTAQIDADALVNQVKAALLKDPKRPVMVRGDANGPYQNVSIDACTVLQQADVGSVGLVTDPEDAQLVLAEMLKHPRALVLSLAIAPRR